LTLRACILQFTLHFADRYSDQLEFFGPSGRLAAD